MIDILTIRICRSFADDMHLLHPQPDKPTANQVLWVMGSPSAYHHTTYQADLRHTPDDIGGRNAQSFGVRTKTEQAQRPVKN